MKRLQDKVAIITGGASGIGEAAVRTFVSEGARVVLADVQEEKGEALAQQVGAHFVRTDVASESDMQHLVNTTIDRFGRIDCLYNNAGFGFATRSLTETPIEEFDTEIAVLLRSTFLGMKLAGAVMKRQQSGTMVNTSSVAAIAGGYACQAYSAAKAGVISLTQCAALEFGESGIRVNCICPGSITTPIFVRGIPFSPDEEREALQMVEAALTHNALRRAGTPDDVARVALWLASEESSFVTGQAIVVDGGLTSGLLWSDMQGWANALYGKMAARYPNVFAQMAAT